MPSTRRVQKSCETRILVKPGLAREHRGGSTLPIPNSGLPWTFSGTTCNVVFNPSNRRLLRSERWAEQGKRYVFAQCILGREALRCSRHRRTISQGSLGGNPALVKFPSPVTHATITLLKRQFQPAYVIDGKRRVQVHTPPEAFRASLQMLLNLSEAPVMPMTCSAPFSYGEVSGRTKEPMGSRHVQTHVLPEQELGAAGGTAVGPGLALC